MHELSKENKTLRISACANWFFTLLNEQCFSLDSDTLKLKMEVSSVDEILTNLAQYKIDVAIVPDYPVSKVATDDFEKLLIFEEQLYLSIPKSHPMASFTQAHVLDFSKDLFFKSSITSNDTWQLSLLKELNINLNFDEVLTDTFLMRLKYDEKHLYFTTSVLSGLKGATEMSERKQKRVYVKLIDKNCKRNIWIMYHKNCSESAKFFISNLKKHLYNDGLTLKKSSI